MTLNRDKKISLLGEVFNFVSRRKILGELRVNGLHDNDKKT